MTMKDRHVLQEVLKGAYRMQSRADVRAKRVTKARSATKDMVVALHNDKPENDKERGKKKAAEKTNGAPPPPSPDERGRFVLKCALCNTEVRYASPEDAATAKAIHWNIEGRHNLTVEELEPQPVAKDVKGPLGRLLNGQKFFVEGVVGNFILEGWKLAPGAFDKDEQLKKIPVVRQITQRQTATKEEQTLKPVTMNAWFEETLVTVIETFDLTSGNKSGIVNSAQSEQGDDNMANKKSAKKTAKGKSNGNGHAGRASAVDHFAVVEPILKSYKKPMPIKEFRAALEGKPGFTNRSQVKAALVAAKKIKFNEKDRTVSLA